MKIKFVCDSGANIHSARKEVINTEDYGFEDDEWLALSDDQKQKVVEDWAYDRLEIYWDEEI